MPAGTSAKPFFGTSPGIKKTISELKAASALRPVSGKALDSTAIKPFRSAFKKYQNRNRSVRGNSTGIIIRREKELPAGNAMLSTPAFAQANYGRRHDKAGSTQQIWSNFLSIDFYENPIGWPPDPNGAVSGSQVIVASNNGLKIYDKRNITDPPLVTPTGYSGERAPGNLFISLEDFFSPVLPPASGISDPHIRYDRLTKRWVVIAIEVNPSQENNLILIAVSDGEKVSDGSSFTFYAFNSSLFPYDPGAPYYPFLDFPRLGVDKNSIVIGGNQFGYDSLTNVAYVIDKKKLLQGQLVVYPFELGVYDFINGTVDGMYTPQAAQNDDPAGNKTLLAGITYYQDALVVASISYYKDQPYLTALTTLPVEPFNNPRDNSHPGSLIPLDQNDTRLLQAEVHVNKLNGKASLWTSHAIGVNQEGHYISGSDSDFVKMARTGSRWYEIGQVYGKPNIEQVGTLTDEDEKSGRRAVQYFNPTIAMSGQGHALLSGTTDAFNKYLNVFAAGRYFGDDRGTLNPPVKATNTTAIYAPYIDFGFGTFFYIDRWGDYSQTVVDPADDQTIWTFQEYANVDDSYGVRVVQFKAPPPATPKHLGKLSNKADNTVVINGKSEENSGFFDPGKDKGGPGYNRLSVRSTGNIPVTDITFISPTKISVRLKTKDRPAGNYFLVITNPDGQIAVTSFHLTGKSENESERPITAAPVESKEDIAARAFIAASNIFPNPTNGEFKLQVRAAKDFSGKVVILSSTGSVVSQNTYNFSKGSLGIPLSLQGLGNGIYLAAVYNEDNILVAVHKIAKQ